MATKPTVSTLASDAAIIASTLNANFDTLATAIQSCLGLSGTSESPNYMTGDLEMNGHAIRNVGSFDINGVDIALAQERCEAFANDCVQARDITVAASATAVSASNTAVASASTATIAANSAANYASQVASLVGLAGDWGSISGTVTDSQDWGALT